MILTTITLAAIAAATLPVAGYLAGVRRGRRARAALRAAHASATARAEQAETARASGPDQRAVLSQELQRVLAPVLASPQPAAVEALQHELRALHDSISTRERGNDAFRDEVRTQLSTILRQAGNPEQLQRSLQKAMAPLLEHKQDGSSDLQRVITEALAPLLERERTGYELSTIRTSGGLGALPALLDTIAQKAALSSLVLSDEAGLPLAASSDARDVDALAGTAAFFLTLSDRAERTGQPRPLSSVLLDDANRMTIHRTFTVGAARYTLSGVARGRSLAPGALDPALLSVERALLQQDYS